MAHALPVKKLISTIFLANLNCTHPKLFCNARLCILVYTAPAVFSLKELERIKKNNDQCNPCNLRKSFSPWTFWELMRPQMAEEFCTNQHTKYRGHPQITYVHASGQGIIDIQFTHLWATTGLLGETPILKSAFY